MNLIKSKQLSMAGKWLDKIKCRLVCSTKIVQDTFLFNLPQPNSAGCEKSFSIYFGLKILCKSVENRTPMDAANDIQKTRYQSMCCTKWWILRWNNFLFLTRYPYNAQFIEKYPHLDFSSFFRIEVRMFLHFLPWRRGTWNPVNHLPSLFHSPSPRPLPCTLEHSSHNLVW